MGRLLFAIMTGNLLGATCAGVVSDLFGWRGVFFVLGGFGGLVLGAARPGIRGVKEAPGHFNLERSGRIIARSSAIRWRRSASAPVFCEAVFMYGVFPYIATMLHQAGETRASIAGIVIAGFGIGGALYGVVVSRLLRRLAKPG